MDTTRLLLDYNRELGVLTLHCSSCGTKQLLGVAGEQQVFRAIAAFLPQHHDLGSTAPACTASRS
jgi:hypothetical protein